MTSYKALVAATILGGGMMGAVWHYAPGALPDALVPAAIAGERTVLAPAPRVDAPATPGLQTAVFAGGCYWGVEGVFSHVKGVRRVESGFAGGPARLKVTYDSVSGGDTGYAEAVRVVYDPRLVSYGTLMRIFFSVIADPTTLNYQGPDHGTQYRSALYPTNAGQAKAAQAYLTQLGQAKLWNGKIVTRVERFDGFQLAESYHQDFMRKNPRHPYILRWDAPKLAAFRQAFPQNYSADWAS